mmetsp:Transcript_59253/g.139760  ORF Transcript_59253/g.139760 Transcript_59253/m.139760 type:complete len:374 (+) Transcript_59253:221-1342(+)
MGDRMAGLQRGDDALGAAQVVEGGQRLGVGDADVLGPADVLQVGMLGADAGVVQAGRDRVRFGDLAVGVLQQIGAVAMQHARRAGTQRGGVLAARDALPRGFDADQAHLIMGDVRVEDADGVAAAAHAGEHGVGLAARHLGHLHQALVADDALEVAHHHRVGVRAGHGADDVEGVLDVGDPVAHRFVERILQRLAAALDRHDGRAEQLHAVDVGALALDVLAAHVDHAFQAVARADRGGGHAMLAGAGLGDDARLAHALGQQRLANDVVDLVRAGVVEVLALEVDLRAAQFAAQALGVVNRAGPADEVRQLLLELGDELRVVAVVRIGVLELVERMDKGLGDEAAAIDGGVRRAGMAEMPGGIGLVVGEHGFS